MMDTSFSLNPDTIVTEFIENYSLTVVKCPICQKESLLCKHLDETSKCVYCTTEIAKNSGGYLKYTKDSRVL